MIVIFRSVCHFLIFFAARACLIVCGASPTMARGLNQREDYWFFDTMIRFHQQIIIVIAQLPLNA